MAHRFTVSVDWNDYGWPVGMVSSLGNCAATGRDMEEMLDKLEEEVRSVLASRGEPEDAEIEFVGFNA